MVAQDPERAEVDGARLKKPQNYREFSRQASSGDAVEGLALAETEVPDAVVEER